MKLVKLAGATSEIWQIFIQDSSSTTGAGLTALAYNSGSLVAYYHRDTDTTATAITLVDMTVGTFTSSGFKKIDDTNMPGCYQFCPPNAALASGAKSCIFELKGASNMAPLVIEVQLVAVNVDDSVRLGMTALPNAAAEAAGGLYTRGTGAGQIEQEDNGKLSINVKQWLRGTIPAVNVTGVPLVDAKYLLGTVFATPATAGIIDVNVKNIDNDAASASGTVTFPNATLASTTGAVGSVTAAVSLSAGDSPVLQSGTAAAGGASTITLASALGADSLPIGCKVKITSGTGAKQARTITAYVDSTKVATVDWAWTTAPDNTSVYTVYYDNSPKLTSALKISGVVLADTLTTYTGNTVQTGDAFARIGAAGAGLTALGDTRIANLDAAVSTRMATFTLPTNFSSLSIDSSGNVKIQSNTKKNQALAKFQFMVRDSTNHAPVTGKTVTVTRSIDGAAQASGTLSAVTEIGSGMYSVDFAAGDLNGNVIILRGTATGSDDVFERIVTFP